MPCDDLNLGSARSSAAVILTVQTYILVFIECIFQQLLRIDMKCKFSFTLLQINSTYKSPMLRVALSILRITLLFCLPAAPVLKQDAFILCLLSANNVSLGIYVISNDNVCLIRLMFVHRNVAETNISMTMFNSPWTKWPPFHRWYFQMHFREWKVL